MFVKRSLAIFCMLFAFSSFCTVEEEVGKILDEALESQKIFRLEQGQKRKRSNLYAFYYDMPEYIRNDPELAQQFMDCMRMTVKEEGLVGPKQRPLALILRIKRAKETAKEDKTTYRSDRTFHDDLAF